MPSKDVEEQSTPAAEEGEEHAGEGEQRPPRKKGKVSIRMTAVVAH
jgi:hypothetical protein